jgi:hypothetical protein
VRRSAGGRQVCLETGRQARRFEPGDALGQPARRLDDARRHRPDARGRARVSGRRRPGAGTARIALEAYPGFTARQVCRGSYKSDVAAMQTPARTANRRRILAALVAGTAGLGPRLELSATWQRKLVADGSGDLLDAVICGLQAAHAAFLPGYGLPADLDPLEGWIAAVPPPASRAATASGS